jgi:hypothetical protein
MILVKIQNWAVVAKRNSRNQLATPDIHLKGIVSGHPGWPDGTEITTSPITHRKGELLISGNGTRYELGQVDPEYAARFPNAKESLLNRLLNKSDEETIRISSPRPS